MIGWWWAAFLVLNLTLNAYSLQGGDGYDLAEVKAFNAIAGIGEVIGLLVSLAAGTLWAAIVLRIERNQAALLTEIFSPTHPHEHAAGAVAKGTFCHQPQARGVKSSKVAKLILRRRFDTSRHPSAF